MSSMASNDDCVDILSWTDSECCNLGTGARHTKHIFGCSMHISAYGNDTLNLFIDALFLGGQTYNPFRGYQTR